MRRETATLVSAAISVIPVGLVAMLGDGRAQYGFGLLLIALPFYCIVVAALVWLIGRVTYALGFNSLAAYLGAAFLVSLLFPGLMLQAYGGWVSTLAGACGLLTAFFLVPILESKERHES
jgi:hypothetical protein